MIPEPQGFLGRAWAHGREDRGFPRDVDRWTADHALRFTFEVYRPTAQRDAFPTSARSA
jgi:hypothetical protein